MDIIAEILNTEKLAEDRLRAAEEETGRIINQAADAEEKLQNEAKAEIESYEAAKKAETDAAIEKQKSIIDAECSEKMGELDKIFEQNHVQWENGIFERIIS